LGNVQNNNRSAITGLAYVVLRNLKQAFYAAKGNIQLQNNELRTGRKLTAY
jgi:hypothetical protein